MSSRKVSRPSLVSIVPTVASGEAVFPVLTSALTVGTPAENAAQAETTGAFSAEVLSPGRLQASFFYSREDRARFSGMDAALRENLSDGLADGLDDQIVSGTNGLLTGTVLANHTVTSASDFAHYISEFGYNRVDGRYAVNTGDLRLVMGATAYAHAGNAYRNASVDRTALDRLMEITSGVRVSAHVPAAASNRQNNVIRRGMRRDYVAPIWNGITFHSRRDHPGGQRPNQNHRRNALRRQVAAGRRVLQAANPDSVTKGGAMEYIDLPLALELRQDGDGRPVYAGRFPYNSSSSSERPRANPQGSLRA